ncbi:uncharacterized protein LOC134241584 [Saccostrea cucullata]|uniref:uncharacterized protein LOC134241584 n=1 Tax=Saccostrea cuccullata TaxID=36930 RepID=UPI002ED35BBC
MSICGSLKGSICCAGSFWNDNKLTCEKCPIGYRSINCSISCIFPSYGEDCQGTCECKENLCDHRFGCNKHQVESTPSHYLSTKNIPKKSSFITEEAPKDGTITFPGLTNLVFYIIVSFIGIFILFFAIFVGTYFYKHCLGSQNIPYERERNVCSNQIVSYKCLNLNTPSKEVDIPTDSTYIDPICQQQDTEEGRSAIYENKSAKEHLEKDADNVNQIQEALNVSKSELSGHVYVEIID